MGAIARGRCAGAWVISGDLGSGMGVSKAKSLKMTLFWGSGRPEFFVEGCISYSIRPQKTADPGVASPWLAFPGVSPLCGDN